MNKNVSMSILKERLSTLGRRLNEYFTFSEVYDPISCSLPISFAIRLLYFLLYLNFLISKALQCVSQSACVLYGRYYAHARPLHLAEGCPLYYFSLAYIVFNSLSWTLSVCFSKTNGIRRLDNAFLHKNWNNFERFLFDFLKSAYFLWISINFLFKKKKYIFLLPKSDTKMP